MLGRKREPFGPIGRINRIGRFSSHRGKPPENVILCSPSLTRGDDVAIPLLFAAAGWNTICTQIAYKEVSSMQAREIMTANPACCTPQDSLQTAAQIMVDQQCGSLPVVDNTQGDRLVGMLTDRDIVCRTLAKGELDGALVQDAMTTGRLWVALPNDSVEKVIQEMEDGFVRRIPVVDDNGKVLGIIATADIAQRLDEPAEVAEVFQDLSQPSHIPHA